MLHQFNPQRSRVATLAGRSVRVGTIPVGSIFYLQDGGSVPTFIHRAPWIVEAWEGTRERRHLATVRCLRTGRRRTVTDQFLRWHDDFLMGGARRESRDILRPGRAFTVTLCLYYWSTGTTEEKEVTVMARNAREARRQAVRESPIAARALRVCRL